MDTIDEMPYADVGSIHHEPTDPVAAYDKSMLLGELDAGAVENIVSVAGPEADPPFILELRHHGGAYARPPAVANAVGGRDASFTMFSASESEPGGLEEVRRVHAALHERMRPWSTGGTLLNFNGIDDVDPASVRAAFTPDDYARLREVKTVYDPGNVFRITQNIPPARA